MAKKEVKVVKFSDIKPEVTEKGAEWVDMITRDRANSDRFSFGIFTMVAGLKSHGGEDGKDEVVFQLEGSTKFRWEGGEAALQPGSALFIPDGVKYSFEAGPEQSRVISVFSPPY